MYKLGKVPARKNAISFALRDYLSVAILPTPPTKVDHEHLNISWGMLGNDLYSDCVLAGAGHETMLWNKEVNKDISFSVKDILAAYSAITGFNPDDPNTDQGTDMQAAASYRRKTGVGDAQGIRHKVVAYLAITPGNKLELKQAIYLFSNVGIGIQFPASAMSQFTADMPWSVVAGSLIEGGHYTPAIGYDKSYIYVVTWGRIQKMTWNFFTRYCDESICYLSKDMLTSDKSPEGFNYKQLLADLKILK